jgi:hypothetical protein
MMAISGRQMVLNRIPFLIMISSAAHLLCMDYAVAGEMLRNPGFEGNYQNGTAGTWVNQSWGDAKVTFLEERNGKHSGAKCQKIVCASSSAKSAAQMIQRGIFVTYGARYRISIWMRSPDLKSKVHVGLRKKSAPYTFYISKSFTVSRQWKQYSFEGVSKNTDKDCLMSLYFQSPGTLYLDDVSCMASGQEAKGSRFTPLPGPISSEYFGFHMHNLAGDIKVPKQHGKSWRLHDAIVTWADLEKSKGQWDFKKFDGIVKKATAEKISLLYTLGITPEWAAARPKERSPYYQINPGSTSEPRNMEDWKNYIRKIAQRYKGKIKYYEIWNEPNARKFFTGSKQKLVDLTRVAAATLKAVDPEIQILTPACVGEDGARYLNEYLKLGGAKYTDIVTFHFYTWGAPEASLEMIRQVKKIMLENRLSSKPLWNTETGWKIQSRKAKGPAITSYHTATEYLARSYLMYRALGVSRFYFYAWDNKKMGLIEADGKDKTCAAVYKRIQDWLTGKEMTGCHTDAKGVWRITLTHGNKKYLVIWHPDMNMTIDRPAGALTMETIHGQTRNISRVSGLAIGPAPILISMSPR